MKQKIQPFEIVSPLYSELTHLGTANYTQACMQSITKVKVRSSLQQIQCKFMHACTSQSLLYMYLTSHLH